MMVKTLYLPAKEELGYQLQKLQRKQYIVQVNSTDKKIVPKGLLSNIFNEEPVQTIVPIDTQFGIVIPKIGANAKIIPNVDTSDEPTYLEALKGGVAHAQGSGLPGDQNHIYIFAHSTDYFWNVGSYNAVFYLLSKLENGDEVNIFYDGKRHKYTVEGQKIIDPSEVEYITRKTPNELLTLQTCWPPGTTLKRLLVFARRSAE